MNDDTIVTSSEKSVTVQVYVFPQRFWARAHLGFALGAGFTVAVWTAASALILLTKYIVWVTS